MVVPGSGSMESKFLVYVLFDPDTREARYVGKTVQGPARFQNHLSTSRLRVARGVTTKIHSQRWVDSLIRKGAMPGYAVLEYCAKSEVSDVERAWVLYFKMIGCRLTNMTAGGDGGSGIPDDETRERRRLSNIKTWSDPGRRKEHAAKMKAIASRPDDARRRPRTEAERAVLSAAMKDRVFTKEHREKIGLAHRGRVFSAETIEKMRAAARSRPPRRPMSPEEKINLLARRWPGRGHGEES
jgi:hypothetical protein